MQEQPLSEPQPDNSHIQRDGGFEFTAWGIHILPETLEEAKEAVLHTHGKDVDRDTPPPRPEGQAA